MNNKNLSYQTKAIDFAIEYLQENKEFKLQSPTGSGKTFIISKLIDQYLENDILNSRKTTFIFIAPSTGKLDYQGYEKISSYIKRGWVKGFDTEYIGTSNAKTPSKTYLSNIDYFKENRVYFIGWQMFKRGTKITEMNSERNDIYRVIENTKQKGINIVLIIDEAHREIKSSKDDINIKQSIINEMNPYKVIKVSATLAQVNEKPDYTITYDDVREECAIKKNVIISDMINEQLEENKQLIVSAIRKQEEIKKAYQKYKIEINPLILIQIPDNINVDNELKTEELLLNQIKNILNDNNFKEGFDYAIWLNNNKTTIEKDKITNNLSPIKFLIFKTAIATGWDIPRANILVRIRDAKSSSFNIQTLGRILRNPFFKYYDNELIDNAFVFTKDQKYSEYIQQENIVIKENEFKNVERSSKAKNSTFSIKKKLIKNTNFDEQEMINTIIKNIIEDAGYKEFLNYEHPNIVNSSVSISTKEVINADTSKINKEFDKKNETQLMLNTSQNLITLFDLYIKY
ncbi:MAG: DEAD/DEAH box helicase family protein, partial [Ureaplasma sp.]|nr:DEAD/DEAH box helicase family protein [Ureaplasma sp.]